VVGAHAVQQANECLLAINTCPSPQAIEIAKRLGAQSCLLSPHSQGRALWSEPMIRVLLVIDVPFYREGLAALLAQSAGVVVTGAVADAHSAAQIITDDKPDVVLLDISAAEARSVCALENAPPVVALAVGETPESVVQWAEAGAIGYVSRNAGLADLLQCLQSAARGETYCSPRIMSLVLHRFAADFDLHATALNRGDDLTNREREILELMGHGLSNKLIASRLHISHATAKNHVHNILDKLRLHSRAEVAAYLHAHTAAPSPRRLEL
jgi:two-component system, NarL family, nitrate/nitrite response regulator NarL